jgi:hypothetical protein
MSLSVSVWLVVFMALAGANLPFVNDRLMALIPRAQPKSLGLRLIELAVLYVLVGLVGLALEQSAGQIYPQKWEFYATTAALFVTLAFPGFVFRYLRKGR